MVPSPCYIFVIYRRWFLVHVKKKSQHNSDRNKFPLLATTKSKGNVKTLRLGEANELKGLRKTDAKPDLLWATH